MLPTPPNLDETMDHGEHDLGEQNVLANDSTDSAPLRGMDICCTSLPDEKRTELAAFIEQMGAKHSYDLTLYVTHLIVGHYDTPKYRYVAKERPDVRPMTAKWIETLRQLWIEDQYIDMGALEREHTLPTLAGLSISMTGCEDLTERQEIADAVVAHGGVYSGDLSKEITHLISFKTEGAKYNAAKRWGLRIVSIEWLRDSLERGMILDESKYHPLLSEEERGIGAWNREALTRTSLGKRDRETTQKNLEEGRKKLRRTASMKLNSQHEGIWGDIVGSTTTQVSRSGCFQSPTVGPQESTVHRSGTKLTGTSIPSVVPLQELPITMGMFRSCRFHLLGFTPAKAEVLHSHLLPQDAEISETFETLPTSSESLRQPYLMIPSDLPVSQHPKIPESHQHVEIVTEWWLERCLHRKRFLEPKEHVIGRPFRRFPLKGFHGIIICSAAFTGIDLRHIHKATELLGGTYSEYLTPQATVLVINSMTSLRQDKMEHAQEWGIPLVTPSWLWDSIETGERLPFKKYKLRAQNAPRPRASTTSEERTSGSDEHRGPARSKDLGSLSRTGSRASLKTGPQPPQNSGMDNSAFESDESRQVPLKPTHQRSRKSGIDSSAFDSTETSHTSSKLVHKASRAVVTDKKASIPDMNVEVKLEEDTQAILPMEDDVSRTEDLTVPGPLSKPEPLTEVSHNSPSKSSAALIADATAKQPQVDITNAVSSLLAKTKSASAQVQESTEGGRRRGRILGRVTSNVSAASASLSRATSVDSTASRSNGVENPSNGSGKSGISGSIEKFMKPDRDRFLEEESDSQPPATQLQYLDEESANNHERVMARLSGEKANLGKGRKMEKALTLGDLSEKPKTRKTRAREKEKAGFR